jgi:hypothetical protein
MDLTTGALEAGTLYLAAGAAFLGIGAALMHTYRNLTNGYRSLKRAAILSAATASFAAAPILIVRGW